MALSRLSPLNVQDVLIRRELYKAIRDGQGVLTSDWEIYEVQPADRLMPELIALKFYGVDTLKWVVCVAAGLDDMREPLEVGAKINLPPTTWLRDKIKELMALEAIAV